jgi:hypothetical protein
VLAAAGCVKDAPAGLAAAGDAPAGPAAADPDAFSRFKDYVGKDLQELDLDGVEWEGLLSAIKQLVPGREHNSHFGYLPWHIWAVATKAEADPSYLLFETERWVMHPGSTPIRLTLFGSSGKVVSETEVDTRHRCYLRDVELREGGGEYPLVVLKTGNGPGPGPGIERQYYAMVGSRFELLRLERGGGQVARNTYCPIHFMAGPTPLLRTEAEWESDLLSEDRLTVLRVLVWVGGAHGDPKEGDEPRPDQERPGQVLLVRRVRQKPTVIARLRELSQSKDQWVREAASLALDLDDTDR